MGKEEMKSKPQTFVFAILITRNSIIVKQEGFEPASVDLGVFPTA